MDLNILLVQDLQEVIMNEIQNLAVHLQVCKQRAICILQSSIGNIRGYLGPACFIAATVRRAKEHHGVHTIENVAEFGIQAFLATVQCLKAYQYLEC